MSIRSGTSAQGAFHCPIPPTTIRRASRHRAPIAPFPPRSGAGRFCRPGQPITRWTSSEAARVPRATPRKATATIPASVDSIRPTTHPQAGTSWQAGMEHYHGGQDGYNAAPGKHTHDHRRAVRTRFHVDPESSGAPGTGFGAVGNVLCPRSASGIVAGGPLQAASASNCTYQLLNHANFADVTGTTNNSNLPGTLSLDQYPDVVGKAAFDPGFGHYEAYGMARFFNDRTLIAGVHDNNTTFGWGAGAAAILPVVPKFVDFQGSFLAGQGIGRYGSAGFADAVVNPITGKLDPLTEVLALAGLIGHANDRLDIYGYAGFEQATRKDIYGTTGGFRQRGFCPSVPAQRGRHNQQLVRSGRRLRTGHPGLLVFLLQRRLRHDARRCVRLLHSSAHLQPTDENMNAVMVSLRYYRSSRLRVSGLRVFSRRPFSILLCDTRDSFRGSRVSRWGESLLSVRLRLQRVRAILTLIGS